MTWNPKRLNKQQTELRRVQIRSESHEQAMTLFFRQHALLHSAGMAGSEPWSFEDQILDDTSEAQMRCIPHVIHHAHWQDRLGVKVCDTGNAMDGAAMAEFSARVNIPPLRAYRIAVGRRTRTIMSQIDDARLRQRVEPSRIQQVLEEGAVVEAARGIVERWSRRVIAGLLLMPATRHSLVHLNEALRLKHHRT